MTAALILPAGVDPYDRSEPIGARFGATLAFEETGQPAYRRGHRPSSLHTSERSAADWIAYSFVVPSGAGNSIPIAGYQPGRKSITLVCPASSANSVIINREQGILDQGQGLTLVAGNSVTLRTEGEVWALATTGTATLEYFSLFDHVDSR
jgi:hypothetical protein